MKYIAIDIETTGLDPETCQILQIGAVIEDTKTQLPIEDLPTFNVYLKRDFIRGTPYALHMNGDIIEKILDDGSNVIHPSNVTDKFKRWLLINDYYYSGHPDPKLKIIAAGKNLASFDQPFLERLVNWKSRIEMSHRKIDPAILFVDWENDESLPNLKTCLERAGIKEKVSHDALEDALQIVKLIRVGMMK